MKNHENKGQGEIRQHVVTRGSLACCYSIDEDYIYYPYYCKIHNPKPAAKKTGNTGGTK